MKKLVFGIGRNDADYVVQPTVDGKRVWCPYYRVWVNMLERCYSPTYHAKQPTYIDCTVTYNWLSFMRFREWMLAQNWEGHHLDKDIMYPFNKLYSPEKCVFVTSSVNNFFIDAGASRGEYKIGVNWHKRDKKFQSRIQINGKQKHLGYFNSEQQAHEAWLTVKLEMLQEMINDPVNEYIRSGLLKHKLRLMRGYIHET